MFVLQPWVAEVGLKIQSILLSGLRAPDQSAYNVKLCVRWLRSICQIDADPGKQSYMQSVPMLAPLMLEAVNELEYCTVHYVHHFADAFAVVAHFHPDWQTRQHALTLHTLIARELFHFHPETREEFIERHEDKM